MQKDGNGHEIASWCIADKHDKHAGFCILCAKQVPCGNMGIKQLLQHCTGAKHAKLAELRFSKTQSRFVVQLSSHSNFNNVSSTSNSSSNLLSQCGEITNVVSASAVKQEIILAKSHTDQVTAAEARWVMYIVEKDLSFESCNGVSELFKQMFGGAVANDFTCSPDKAKYITRFGLAPYFKATLMKDMLESGNGYTIHYDETTNSQVKKQLDLVVRFWSADKDKVVVRYLESLFFGHAPAESVANGIMETLTNSGLPLNKLTTRT
jgi:hypothetical protein